MESGERDRQFKLWLLGGLLIALPLLSYPQAFLPPEISGGSRSFVLALPWARMGLLAAIGIFVWQAFQSQGSFVVSAPRDWLTVLGLFALTSVISLAGARNVCVSISALADSFVCAALALAACMWGREAGLRRLVFLCVLAAAAAVVYTLLRIDFTRMEAMTTVNRNVVADYLIFSVPFIVCWSLGGLSESENAQKRRLRWAIGGAVLAGLLIALYFCQSRAAWGALVVVAFIATAIGLAIRWPRWKWAVVAAFILVAGVALVAAWKPISRAFESDVRLEIWRGTCRLIEEQPVLGAGPGTFVIEYPPFRTREYFEKPKAAVYTDHAHNEWLERAAESGLLGLLAFAAVWLYAARHWWHKRGEMRAENWAFAVATVMLLAHGSMEVSLQHPPGKFLVWLAAGLSLSGLPLTPVQWRLARSARAPLLVVAAIVIAGFFYFFLWLPLSSDGHWCRANIAARLDDKERVIAEREAAVAAQPCRVEALYELAIALERAGTREERLAEVLDRLRMLAPDYKSVNLRTGLWLCRHREFAKSIPFFEREVALDAGNPLKPELRAAFAQDLVYLARAYMDAGQRANAAGALRRAKTFAPDDKGIDELLRALGP